MGELCNLIST